MQTFPERHGASEAWMTVARELWESLGIIDSDINQV